MLDEYNLKTHLGNRSFRFYPQVESTQDLAATWLREGAPAGAVVIADEQVTGRGRLQRAWQTPPGQALALSIILRPPRRAMPQVTMLGAVSVARLLDELGADDVGIKWPNDVQLNGRKVCGILPEALWDGDRLAGVVLGMGINVRVDFTGTELADRAISIEPALGRTLDRSRLVAQLLSHIDALTAQLGTPVLADAWQARLVTLGQQVTVGGVSGEAVGADADGALLVRDSAGTTHRVLAGDVT